jgi:hypothetical protein
VNPALDRALEILQKFAIDVRNGKVSDDGLRFGAPWRGIHHALMTLNCAWSGQSFS